MLTEINEDLDKVMGLVCVPTTTLARVPAVMGTCWALKDHRKVKQHKGPFMDFYTETNPVSHSQVVRSVYNPQFCLHLITVILFVCMLYIHLDSVCHSPSRFITGYSFLTRCGILYEKVGWSSLSCLFTRPCCKDCLLASAP